MAKNYTIGTQKGYDLVNQVKSTGQSAQTTDGATLSLGADGNVYAFKNGQKLSTDVTYAPAPATTGGGVATTPTAPAPTMPSGFQGSATGVAAYTPEQATITKKMNENSQKWWTATPEEKERLHAENQQLAAKLGGSVTYSPSTGTWSGAAGYTSQESTQIDGLLNAILNRQPFSYDYKTDPAYLAYEDKYKRLGDRAREDTLGDVASLTGGLPSSWAVSAASQAQNDYNQQLSDVIPTLYDAAYNRYVTEDSMKRSDLGLVMDVDDTNYNRYRDTVSDSQWQQSFDYQKDRDKTSDNQWQQTFDWNKTVDQWNMDNTAATQKFDQLMTKWQLTGVADEEVAAELGVPVGATTESYYFNKAQLELDKAKLAKSGSGNGTKTETYETKKGREIVLQTARDFMSTGSGSQIYAATANVILSEAGQYGLGMEDYFAMCKELGITEETANNVWRAKLAEYSSQPQDVGYEYYASLMGKADDPEEWLESNKYSLPEGMYDKLFGLL